MKHMTVLMMTLLAGLSVAQSNSSKLPKVTKQGDVYLSRSKVSLPGGMTQDMSTVGASFYKVDGATAATGIPERCMAFKSGDGAAEAAANASGATATPKAPVSLDAGNPLPVHPGGAAYATLQRQKNGSAISYAASTPTLPPPPAKLVIDIPGAKGGFPAMKGKTFPSTAALKFTAPAAGEAVTLQTNFAWSNPTREATATVILMGQDEEHDVTFVCYARDDGSFGFPAAFQSELKRQGFVEGRLSSVGRMNSRSYREGDALLNVTVSEFEIRTE
ncbi:hypothetical protein HNR42_000757 [Deinobacterium chartae]|uniref:Uncharacterized protein n=1 Tax=Deinobacterium chartae TaxID=521158 RepID=A0A841HWV9_9DEIO|nr:hypothetical protein [Deinobacterium chartae]MBB6097343.1 hypothetical protein [Deinobacterium chartae]